MRARAALLSALLVALPLTAGAVLAIEFWRRDLLDVALRYSDKGLVGPRPGAGATIETCKESIDHTRDTLPSGMSQYCVQDLVTGFITDPGVLENHIWPEALGGPGDRRPLRIVETDPTADPPFQLVTVNTLKREQTELDTLILSAVLVVAGLTFLTGTATWFAVGRALRPMEAIRLRFTELSAHHLNQRVPVPRSDNEIGRLARTLNETLDRLEEAMERQRRFTSDASHELRTPLAALRAELEIAGTRPERADWPSVVEGALGDVLRLQRLTEDLLTLTRLDTGQPPTGPGDRLDLARLIQDECARRRPPDHLRLTVSAPNEPVPVRGRASLLARVLGNLLDNADRYAERWVEVTVRRDAACGTAVLEVRDDGPGIPCADRERVFDRFTRVDDARGHDTGGTGLGLAIARHVATVHRGSLTLVDSDRGACFLLALPLDADPAD
ncbi:sensor histidine kinase (plasmid) [Streptomyces clavuligerus]|nr:multi-sensor signal transduction histidine kinase [Streptomyces clavuligerus]MBY6306623.1 HAMP domain-containing histidine kinase [Streptomyces clavuligerus]QCS10769.1 sensor histidine kinase [Streptomyces clavuligerus]QPJ98419.1 HAMP domain-containing protein [Streptomyces clavuligerus]